MATSGAAPWFPKLGELIDDALEIGAGIDPATASQRHLESALRSYNRVVIDLDNEGDLIQKDAFDTYTLAAGQPYFFTPPDTLAINLMQRRDGGREWVIPQRSFLEYQRTFQKGQPGSPMIYAINFSVPRDFDGIVVSPEGVRYQPTSTYSEGPYSSGNYSGAFDEPKAYDPSRFGPAIFFSPVPDVSTEIVYMRVRLTQKGMTLGEDPDIRRTWLGAITLLLAADLALKFKPDKHAQVKKEAEQSLDKARTQNRSRADLVISARTFDLRRSGGRRRYRY